MRECLEAARDFYMETLKGSETGKAYIEKRKLTPEQLKDFAIGVAPDSYSATYDHLLKKGFSKSEIVGSGIVIQKDLDGKIYDPEICL